MKITMGFIPGGCTKLLHVSINKPLKVLLHELYDEYIA